MGKEDGPIVRQGDRGMTDTELAPIASVSKPSARRTRVKLRRVNADFSKPYPPDGDQKRWWGPTEGRLGHDLQ